MNQNAQYVNVYLETTTGLLNEYVQQIIHLRTQLRITQEELRTSREQLGTLTSEATVKDEMLKDLTYQAEQYELLKKKYSSTLNKLTNYESLLKQVKDMKKMIADRDDEIEKLRGSRKRRKKKEPVLLVDEPFMTAEDFKDSAFVANTDTLALNTEIQEFKPIEEVKDDF